MQRCCARWERSLKRFLPPDRLRHQRTLGRCQKTDIQSDRGRDACALRRAPRRFGCIEAARDRVAPQSVPQRPGIKTSGWPRVASTDKLCAPSVSGCTNISGLLRRRERETSVGRPLPHQLMRS